MSKFLFEGDYKRKPAQSLGGRSRLPENRDITVRRAELERQRRENERARASAVLVIQASFRGMRERRHINLELREEFQQNLSGQYTVENLERQMMRLNYFFNPSQDMQTLGDLGKAMLMAKDKLMENMLKDDRSVLRLTLILEKCLAVLIERGNPSRTTVLRLLETFTDWNQIEKVSTAANMTSSKTEEVMAIIWAYLVLQKDFFQKYKQFLETRLEVKDEDTARSALQHYDFTVFYHRFLEAIQRLSVTSRSFVIAKNVYVTKELVQVLLLKLAESLTIGILPHRNDKPKNGVLEFVICPRVAHELSLQRDGKSLWCEHWLEVVSRLISMYSDNENDVETSIKLRPVLYSFLILIRCGKLWHDRHGDILKLLNSLIVSVDNRKHLFTVPPIGENGEYENEEEMLEDVEMQSIEQVEAAFAFFTDRRKVYIELQSVLNNMQLSHWIGDFSVPKWNSLYPMLGCLIEMEPKLAAVHFRFLSDLYNKASFMRSLCLHLLKRIGSYKNELVVMCWLLNQLMNILHDGEFLEGLSLNADELLDFIQLLQDSYTEIILGDKDVSDRMQNYIKKEISYTLMALHDRNTRINLYSEDVFVSSKFKVVFPMETHNIRFQDFKMPFGPGENLTLLDQRLLRVLIDFPFALSFRNRVSIWHQILHSDLVERQITENPLDRQHIQIRRTYIYEDAYEKLSSENVADLRADIRISLVNVVGVEEAGVDGGGLLREFLTEATKAGVDPNRGLFRVDSENRIYPNPIAKLIFPDFYKHFFFMGRLVGKALYRQILLELPLAAFFMQVCAFGSVSSAVDYLATLDPDLHKNLLKLRNFDGDWSELGLDFTLATEELGDTKVIELKPNGRNIAVDNTNVIQYIHLVADYKINREIQEECKSFRNGLLDVVPILRIFSWKEMQTLISGSDKPIDVVDWKANTNYAGGYSDTHDTIVKFWQVVEHFDEEHLRKLLKFVTSCSRPPLLGFRDLVPKFGISSAGASDRLPTAATCMNLLKLPEFIDIETLRERLVYAINAQAGFELS